MSLSSEAVFLGNIKKIRPVYSEDVCTRLGALCGLDATRAYTAEEAEEHGAFEGTRYIFSTWGMPALSEEQIARLFPSLQAVFYAAGTVQGFARPFLARGISVFSAWAANAVPVSEYALAQILLANKGYFRSERIFRASRSKREAGAYASGCAGNYGGAVGLCGVGMIGKLTARLLGAHNLKLYAFDPFLPESVAKELNITLVGLEELFSTCRTVSNHLANNAATKGIFRYGHFASMPQNGVFINTGRGAQVREDELCRALADRPDISAVLDVTFPEPPEQDSPLYTLDNVFLTPHIAGSKGDEVKRMGEYMEEEARRFVSGESTRYGVTEKMLETMA